MSIKQWTTYCKSNHEWEGLVDLGGQLDEIDENGNRAKATKAIVFMLVNSNGGFKTPVAYYLIKSLTGAEKAVLLNDLLIHLDKKNINVTSVTFDGDEGNQKACNFFTSLQRSK